MSTSTAATDQQLNLCSVCAEHDPSRTYHEQVCPHAIYCAPTLALQVPPELFTAKLLDGAPYYYR